VGKAKNKLPIYALDPQKVRESDIVLLLGTPWGHAALCTQTNELFEAMPEGLHRRLISATYVHKRKQIRVLRPCASLDVNAVGKRLADYAEDLYGEDYNFGGALFALLKHLPLESEGKYFCSEVIAQIFMNYGHDLRLGSPSNKVKPRDFLKAVPETLGDVTQECLRRVDPVVQALEHAFILEAAEKSRWAACEMKMNRKVFRTSMKLLEKAKPKDVYSLRQLWQWLGYEIRPNNADRIVRLESHLLRAMEISGYWQFYHQLHENRLATIEQIVLYTRNLGNDPLDIEGIDHWLDFHQYFANSLVRRYEYLDAFRSWFNATNLRLFSRLVEIFATQINDMESLQEQYEKLRTIRRRLSSETQTSG
jgi:hypothetical protein